MDLSGKRAESYVFYLDEDERSLPSEEYGGFSLINNEKEICEPCYQVILYRPFCDNRQGILGTLRCTTFRLIFVPLGDLESQTSIIQVCRFRRYFRHETPLANILEIFYTSGIDKKLKLLSNVIGQTDLVSLVKIYCKDFGGFAFDFSACQHGTRQLLNSLLNFLKNHSIAAALSTALDIAYEVDDNKKDWLFPTFSQPMHWEMQLRRLNVPDSCWRVKHFNEKFDHIDSYPRCFVLPSNWTDGVIISSCAVWNKRRIPIWCWSSQNGSALIRSAQIDIEGDIGSTSLKLFCQAVSESHYLKRAPVIRNVSYISVREICQAAENLRKACSLDSASQFWETDVRWNTELEKTGWLSLVGKCLFETDQIRQLLIDDGLSVIVEESSNMDAAGLISSLVQLCLDKYYRTVEGFHILLQKEWCALGHPFSNRLSIVSDEYTPVFLLFLDCVHQLLNQYPSEFEFSHFYLIGLWDVALSGCSKSFLMTSQKESIDRKFENIVSKLRHAWFPGTFYHSDFLKLCRNPLYAFKYHLAPLEQRLGRERVKSNTNHDPVSLHPNFTTSNIRLWSECYLRWSSACQISRGGQILLHLESINVCAELSDLLREVSAHSTQDARAVSQTLSLKSVDRLDNLDRFLQSPMFTSGFPYSAEVLPVPELRYALPVKTDLQTSSTLTTKPRSRLELSAISELNTDIRRLSVARNFSESAFSNNQHRHQINNSTVTSPVDLKRNFLDMGSTSSSPVINPSVVNQKQHHNISAMNSVVDELKNAVKFRKNTTNLPKNDSNGENSSKNEQLLPPAAKDTLV